MHYPFKVACLGGPGSFSRIGCEQRFPDASLQACANFGQAFDAVETDQCDLGLVPIENSIAGRVTEVHMLLCNSPLFIVGEVLIPIEHSLVSLPGSKISGVREVFSHLQALSQCSNYLAQRGFQATPAGATSEAARLIKEKGDPSLAAIAHQGAAEYYALDVLESGIQDFDDNVTRFVILSRNNADPTLAYDNPVTTIKLDFGEDPSDLHRVLSGFAQNDVKITRIESYLSRETLSSTSFMIDFLGTPKEPKVQRVFDILEQVSKNVQHFGTYESAKLADSFVS